MPRFFFDLHNDEILCDDIGTECAGLDAARALAASSVAELIGEHIIEGRPVDLRNRIVIKDHRGESVLTVCFGEFFRGANDSPGPD